MLQIAMATTSFALDAESEPRRAGRRRNIITAGASVVMGSYDRQPGGRAALKVVSDPSAVRGR